MQPHLGTFEPMKILLTQQDIITAIDAFVSTQFASKAALVANITLDHADNGEIGATIQFGDRRNSISRSAEQLSDASQPAATASRSGSLFNRNRVDEAPAAEPDQAVPASEPESVSEEQSSADTASAEETPAESDESSSDAGSAGTMSLVDPTPATASRRLSLADLEPSRVLTQPAEPTKRVSIFSMAPQTAQA